MVIGVMELHLALYDNESLKAKRSVVKRVINRTRNTFNIAAAEVDDQDMTDHAIIGIVAVGSDQRYLDGLLTKVEGFIERMALADVVEAPRTFENF